MAMRGRPRMVGISLVDMLRRHRRQGDVRHQDQAENDPPAGLSHALMIMATGRTARQTRGSPESPLILPLFNARQRYPSELRDSEWGHQQPR